MYVVYNNITPDDAPFIITNRVPTKTLMHSWMFL